LINAYLSIAGTSGISGPVRKTASFFEFSLMFVPSLSWQNDRFIYKWRKNAVFRRAHLESTLCWHHLGAKNAFFTQGLYQKRLSYQDRLGTTIGEVGTKGVFSQGNDEIAGWGPFDFTVS
jgi:hypothetical protein